MTTRARTRPTSPVAAPRTNGLRRSIFGVQIVSSSSSSLDFLPDIARRATPRHRARRTRPAASTDPSFFELSSTVIIDLENTQDEMPVHADTHSRNARRQVLRMDAQDGPWTISVAENPHQHTSYSLYVKTPTHNLTLTRSIRELFDLDNKLRDANPHISVPPPFPLDPHALPQPPKRKSAFLNTLSRLASPGTPRRTLPRSGSTTTSPLSPSGGPTPLRSPRYEASDPFLSDGFDASAVRANGDGIPLPTPNPTLTGLAAYLTTVANDQLLRQTRSWKRFVRVRTDDLESVRVERAIKRVRSDIASHVSPSTVSVHLLTADADDLPASNLRREKGHHVGDVIDIRADVDVDMDAGGEDSAVDAQPVEHAHDKTGTEDTATEERAPTPRSPLPAPAADEPVTPATSVPPAAASEPEPTPAPTPVIPADDDTPPTPIAGQPPSHIAARIPRSQSADPDKAARMSRLFTPSSASESSAPETASQTEDDSMTEASSTQGGKAKKRSKSMDPGRLRKKREPKRSKVEVTDFEMLRVLGKGCAGKVLLVRYKKEGDLYALKAITKRHVLAHQELQHTLTEQAVLKRMAAEGTDPFVVRLHYSFHDKENLFLVMDFHPGGDLATQLARWGRLGRDRARFYAAEIVEGVEGLHAAGVIYRDLKPENILIAADGHIVLTDFGLSKEFPRRASPTTAPATPSGQSRFPNPPTPYWMAEDGGLPARHQDTTSTFCGTAEYLAPEVIQGLPYSYEVDWWSFGTMLFEMLTGITPFWADNHSDMYVRVLQDELQFPDERAMDQDTKSLIRGLLQRNPALRIREPRIKRHPYFSMIDWSHVYYKRYIPPYIPPIDPSNASDTQNFDDTFLDMEPVINDGNDEDDDGYDGQHTDTDRTDGEDSGTTPSQSRSSSAVRPVAEDEGGVDVFDGYSFKGRHSVIIDGDDEDEDEEEEEGDEEGDEDEEEEEGTRDILAEINGAASPEASSPTTVAHPVVPAAADTEDTIEPKTPEARRAGLPEPEPVTEEPKPEPEPKPAEEAKVVPETATEEPTQVEPTPRKSEDGVPRSSQDGRPPLVPRKSTLQAALAAAAASNGPDIHRKEKKGLPAKPATMGRKPGKTRREKSGVPYLDRDLSDTAEDEDVLTERDEEDEDWDFIDADGERGEERNGARGTSLFARGVVDRYRLAVFRKGSTPSRTISGVPSMTMLTDPMASPSPTTKERRGRTGLPFRRTPKQLLRTKPPANGAGGRSSSSVLTSSKSLIRSPSMTFSNASSSRKTGTTGALTTPVQTNVPSLRSKQSATSFGSPRSGSDVSTTEEPHPPPLPTHARDDAAPEAMSAGEHEKQKNKKLKKYKEGAEKVLSLFASPR